MKKTAGPKTNAGSGTRPDNDAISVIDYLSKLFVRGRRAAFSTHFLWRSFTDQWRPTQHGWVMCELQNWGRLRVSHDSARISYGSIRILY